MRALIDGHNALHVLRIRGEDHAAQRQELLRRVRALAPGATVYFDARGRTGPRPPRRCTEGGLRVVYCSDREADEAIIEAVRNTASPQDLLVVTDDREVMGRAAQLGAKTRTVRKFFAARGNDDRGGRPAGPLMSPDDFGLPDVVLGPDDLEPDDAP